MMRVFKGGYKRSDSGETARLWELVSRQGELIRDLEEKVEILEHPVVPLLKVKKLLPDAVIPTRGTPGSGGLDLYSTEDVEIPSFSVVGIKTHLAFEFPEGRCGFLITRSSFGKNMVLLSSGMNLIDEDFRGDLMVYLMNVGEYSWKIKKGDRIAQMAVVKIDYCEPVEVDKLSETQRGTGGFGSTGR